MGLVVVLGIFAGVADIGVKSRNCHGITVSGKLAPGAYRYRLHVVDILKSDFPILDDSHRGAYRLHALHWDVGGGVGLSLYVLGSQTKV